MLLLSGCARITKREYAEFVHEIDGKSELSVSTYPAGFPDRVSHVPFLYTALETPDRVYFQVFVRDAAKKSGPNPHVESIRIHSFTYRVGGGLPTELLTDYAENFWMQGDPTYDNRELAPIPFYDDKSVRLEIEITLNGVRYSIDGEMPGREMSRLRPLPVLTLAR